MRRQCTIADQSEEIRDRVKNLMNRIASEERRPTECVFAGRCEAACLDRYTAVECNAENCNQGDTDDGNRQFLTGPNYPYFRVT